MFKFLEKQPSSLFKKGSHFPYKKNIRKGFLYLLAEDFINQQLFVSGQVFYLLNSSINRTEICEKYHNSKM